MKSDTQVTGMAVAVAEGFAGSGVKLNNCWWKSRFRRLDTSYSGEKQWHWWRTCTSCSYFTVRQRSGPIARQILSILLSWPSWVIDDHDANEGHDGDHCDDGEDDNDDDDIGRSMLLGSWKRVFRNIRTYLIKDKQKTFFFVDSTKFSFPSFKIKVSEWITMTVNDLTGEEFYPEARLAQERKFWVWFVGENGGNWNFMQIIVGDFHCWFKSSFQHLKSPTDQRVWDCSSVSHHVDHLGKKYYPPKWGYQKTKTIMDFIRKSEPPLALPLPPIWTPQLFLISKFWTGQDSPPPLKLNLCSY